MKCLKSVFVLMFCLVLLLSMRISSWAYYDEEEVEGEETCVEVATTESCSEWDYDDELVDANVTFEVEGDPNGIFKVTQKKAREYTKRTGTPAYT